jgi:nucleoside-diphosphate-sugar epimerase
VIERIEVRVGALENERDLMKALDGVTAVIHCAGKTKALHAEELTRVNVDGTARLIQAVNQHQTTVRRVVHLSSLAAGHPATAARPALEDDPPAPVSAYGRSKLAAEQLVRETCQTEHVVLRPPAVYGPGDADFLHLFKAARSGFSPRFGAGRQTLSLVYADDLAEVAIASITHPRAAGKTFHVAHPVAVTTGQLADEVSAGTGGRTFRVSLPAWGLVPLSWAGELFGRLTGRPQILSVDRRRELMAPGWVCSTRRMEQELALSCGTDLREGVRQTFEWYRSAGWL